MGSTPHTGLGSCSDDCRGVLAPAALRGCRSAPRLRARYGDGTSPSATRGLASPGPRTLSTRGPRRSLPKSCSRYESEIFCRLADPASDTWPPSRSGLVEHRGNGKSGLGGGASGSLAAESATRVFAQVYRNPNILVKIEEPTQQIEPKRVSSRAGCDPSRIGARLQSPRPTADSSNRPRCPRCACRAWASTLLSGSVEVGATA